VTCAKSLWAGMTFGWSAPAPSQDRGSLRPAIIEVSPMRKMHQPPVPEEPVPILTERELAALLKVTGGNFDSRRNHAMIRLFVDCGLRVGEMAGLKLSDVDLDLHDVVHVVGKGSRPRAVPFGSKTGTALDRYLRERVKHKLAKIPELWIGNRAAPMTESGMSQMLRRRGLKPALITFTRTGSATLRVRTGLRSRLQPRRLLIRAGGRCARSCWTRSLVGQPPTGRCTRITRSATKLTMDHDRRPPKSVGG